MRQQKPHPPHHQLMGTAFLRGAERHTPSPGSLGRHRVARGHRPRLPCRPRTRPLHTKAQGLAQTRPLTGAGSAGGHARLGDTCVLGGAHVCAPKSRSPRMSGSHVFKIEAHFSEVISGKTWTLITAIKGKYCLGQQKRLFGTCWKRLEYLCESETPACGRERPGSRRAL